MPPVSAAQRRFMRWSEEHPDAPNAAPKGVAKEFNDADQGGKLPERKSRDDKTKARYGSKK